MGMFSFSSKKKRRYGQGGSSQYQQKGFMSGFGSFSSSDRRRAQYANQSGYGQPMQPMQQHSGQKPAQNPLQQIMQQFSQQPVQQAPDAAHAAHQVPATTGVAQQPAIICASCNASIPAGSKFCLQCGTKVEDKPGFCMSCGASLPLEAKFCPSCGTPR